MKAFINPNDPDNTKMKITLRDWLRLKFALASHISIEIYENICTEPNCIHTETVFTIELNENDITHYKISKPLVYIRKWDLENIKKIDSIITHKH